MQIPLPSGATDLAQVSKTLTIYIYGVYAVAAGRQKDAEKWFLEVMKAQEAKLGGDDLAVAMTLQEIGRCL